MIKNYVKDMLETLKTKTDCNYPEIDLQKLKNIHIFGQHIELYTIDEYGTLISKDVTREFVGGDND